MAYQKLQGIRAINVYPQDNVQIPPPSAQIASGTNDAVVVGYLQDSTVDFFELGVKSGDTVYNTSTGAAATVLNVVTATDLLLNNDIFLATPNNYAVYSKGIGEDGPVLYVGTGGTLVIKTAGLDEVTFTNVANGSFIPIMVYSVQATGTTCSDIIALW